ncbi:MAG: hypothetical protein ACLU38_12435 [Dysosmobacter sp.]
MNRYKESLRQYFSAQAKALRKKRKLTQEEMSGAVTYHGSGLWRFRARLQLLFCNRLLFFLLMLEPDELAARFAQMKKQFRDQDQQEVA